MALACVPALAYLATLALKQVLPGDLALDGLNPRGARWVETAIIHSGGFIVTSLIWGTMLAHPIEGKHRSAVTCLVVGGVCALFGVIHSPLPSTPIVAPAEAIRRAAAEGRAGPTSGQTPYHWATAYWAAAGVVALIGRFGIAPDRAEEPESAD